MIELRPYQRETHAAIRREEAQGVTKQLVVLPTGAGKTIVFACLVAETVKGGGRALITVHRDELLALQL